MGKIAQNNFVHQQFAKLYFLFRGVPWVYQFYFLCLILYKQIRLAF